MVDPTPLFRAESYADRWLSWVQDPRTEATGIILDHTPSGPIKAPTGKEWRAHV